ncbi:MAG: S8 family peptidase [Lachnospiraceae bacterium]|nr:S8 family peptidase [Lachnospiraceae bacterium]
MPCTEPVTSEEYADFIARYFKSPEDFRRMWGTDCIDFISHQYAVIYAPLTELATPVLTLSAATYSAIPKLYTLSDSVSAEAAGIARAARLPVLAGGGRGVIIGFVDTGIDYQNPLFRNPDGTTRILGIWDQTFGNGNTVPGNTFRSLYGTQYTHEQINEALRTEDPLSVVPSTDTDGHGTFLASIAAGNADEANGFTGAAPGASIAVVKLKPAKQYLRDFFQIPEAAAAYQENDIMMGVSYLYSIARQYSMPIVVCLGVSTNQGSHTGHSPLDIFLDEVSSFFGSAVVVAAGNENGYSTHYRGSTSQEAPEADVELRVGEASTGFTMELWAQNVELYRIGFVSPTGEVVQPLPTSTDDQDSVHFLLDRTEISVYYKIADPSTGSQLIFIRFRTPMTGIWHIRVSSALSLSGVFHIWLPVHDFLDPGTYFLRPDPDMMITGPGNAQYPITVSAYNHITGGIYIHSSRGFSRTGQIKPEIAAPGVDILGAGLAPGQGAVQTPVYVRRSGTSAAAAHAAGAAALLLKWGILDGNDFFMSTLAIKTYFIRGANRNPESVYPNREFGYGTLDLYAAFLSLAT